MNDADLQLFHFPPTQWTTKIKLNQMDQNDHLENHLFIFFFLPKEKSLNLYGFVKLEVKIDKQILEPTKYCKIHRFFRNTYLQP